MAAPVEDRDLKIARVVDREIAPIWHDRFSRLIFRELPPISAAVVLDVHCGPGHTTTELLARLDDQSRVVALEPDPAMIGIARSRIRPEWKNRVYFKTGDIGHVADMGPESYDLVVANLVLGETHEYGEVIAELVRVTKPGGQVLASLPLRGSWIEVEDLFHEVLASEGLDEAVRRLGRLAHLRPTGPMLADALLEAGVAADHFVIEQERFSLLFPSGREFLFAPAVEHGPLRLWKAIIGNSGTPQELFWRLKEAIDGYYSNHVLAVSIVAGLVRVEVPDRRSGRAPLARRYWQRYPSLDALWSGRTGDEEVDIEVDLDLEDPGEPAPRSVGPRSDLALDGTDRELLASFEPPSADEDRELEQMLDEVFEFGEAEPRTMEPEPPQIRPRERTPTLRERMLELGAKRDMPAPTGTGVAIPPPPLIGMRKNGSPRPTEEQHGGQDDESG